MTTSSSGSVKWSQVSEDLVPVNITCVQPTLEGLAAARQQQQQQQQVELQSCCSINTLYVQPHLIILQSSNGTASAPASAGGVPGANGSSSGGGAGASQVSAAEQVIFHITAYNSQVEKILDVRLVQPGEKRRARGYVTWNKKKTTS